MKKLEQKVYELASTKGIDLRPYDVLQVVVNNNTTDLTIKDIFKNVGVRSTSLIGYSLLQFFKVTENEDANFPLCLEKDGIYIRLFSQEKGDIFFKKVRNPVVQLDDKDTSEEELNEFISNLKSKIPITITEEPVKEELTEEPVKEELTEEPVKEELTEEPVKEELTEEPVKEEITEVIEKNEFPYHLTDWEKDEKELLSKGYIKHEINHESKQYVVFVSPENNSDDYIISIIDGHHYQLDIKDIKEGLYKFIDMDLKEAEIKIENTIPEFEETKNID